MRTECSPERVVFGTVEGRVVDVAFDGGVITSDAGALILGPPDRAIDLVRRFAACFTDRRHQELIEHTVETLVGQRVFGRTEQENGPRSPPVGTHKLTV